MIFEEETEGGVQNLKVLVVTQYFWPENFQINHLTKGLKNKGHHVTILTGLPNYPEGSFYAGYSFFKGPFRENYQGMDIVRVPFIPRGRAGGLRLVLNYLSFSFFATLYGLLLLRGSFDIVFTYQPSPVTVGIPSRIIARLKGARSLFWVQDLWPESLVATGAVRSKLILVSVRWLVRFVYRGCDAILIQSEAFRKQVESLADSKKIFYFPQSVDEFFKPIKKSDAAIKQGVLPDGFKIMFAGNIGVAQDFETILSAAELLQSHADIHFVVLGDGRRKEWVQNEVRTRGLTQTFHLIGSFAEDQMPLFFAHADAMLVTLRDEQVFALTIPTKIQAYMACAKPIVAGLSGEGRRIVIEAQAGFGADAGNAEQLAAAIKSLYGLSEDERAVLGENAKAYSEQYFNRNRLVNSLIALMKTDS